MVIDFRALTRMGFQCESRMEGKDVFEVSISPREHRDIAKELQELTELSKRDCYELQDQISVLQIIAAIKKTS